MDGTNEPANPFNLSAETLVGVPTKQEFDEQIQNLSKIFSTKSKAVAWDQVRQVSKFLGREVEQLNRLNPTSDVRQAVYKLSQLATRMDKLKQNLEGDLKTQSFFRRLYERVCLKFYRWSMSKERAPNDESTKTNRDNPLH